MQHTLSALTPDTQCGNILTPPKSAPWTPRPSHHASLLSNFSKSLLMDIMDIIKAQVKTGQRDDYFSPLNWLHILESV